MAREDTLAVVSQEILVMLLSESETVKEPSYLDRNLKLFQAP